MSKFNLFEHVESVCKIIDHKKVHQKDIMLSAVEELGELSEEVKISHGLKPKQQGVDGIVGESVDVILCALDMIYTELGTLQSDDLNMIFESKLNKWKTKYCGQ